MIKRKFQINREKFEHIWLNDRVQQHNILRKQQSMLAKLKIIHFISENQKKMFEIRNSKINICFFSFDFLFDREILC